MANKHTNINDSATSYAKKPRHETRRTDYAIHDETWIKTQLLHGAYGILGSSLDNQPFLTPVLFVYIEEDHALYYHGAQVGRMRANAALNPNTAFNVSEIGRILPDPLAIEFSIEYNSVTVFGTTTLVENEQEAARVLQKLMDKYAPHLKPGQDYTPSRPEDLKRTAVYKLAIEDWSGKQKQAPPDFPGAYMYDHLPVIKPQQ